MAGVYAGWTVPMEYDPLLAKLAVWADDREQRHRPHAARARASTMWAASAPTSPSSARSLDDAAFRAGNLHTGFIDEFFARQSLHDGPRRSGAELAAALVALLHTRKQQPAVAGEGPASGSNWRSAGRDRLLRG